MHPTPASAAHQRAPEKLAVDDAATYCGISTSYLNKKRVEGDGPTFIKIGARVVYSIKDLDDWLDARRRTSTTGPGKAG
jgi:predicted DNA-binding transcriptional regulator AlpA